MISAVVGAGGKTTLIRRLARKYRERGDRVLVLTSTRMYIEEDTLLDGDAETIIRALEERGYAMAGMADGEKMAPLPDACYERVCRYADVVLIEADGSKHMPLKVPGAHEPVICDKVDEIIVVCGLHALGMKAKDAVHRLELAEGLDPETTIRPEHIQELVMKGYVNPLRERYPDKEIRLHPTHDGSLYQRALAALIRAGMDVSLIREEWFMLQPWLIICGGGHVSVALAKMAACLDFRIKVLDDRAEFANRERFPMADAVICDSFEHLECHLEPNACCVVVTRGHRDDFTCVKTILNHRYRYLGMIGSRMKVRKTFENLRAAGATDAQLASIHAPIGLDIGAVTPGEIAVSILAEIIAEKNRDFASSASRELLDSRMPGVLCIIVEKTGSSPRGVGSMMLVGRDEVIGSIGGGAVEFAAIEDARSHPGACMREYHLNNRDAVRLGMICGGSNKVLFLPV